MNVLSANRRGPRPRFTVKTSIQLTDSQAEYLDRCAVERNTSVAHLIRQAVDQWIERDERKAA